MIPVLALASILAAAQGAAYAVPAQPASAATLGYLPGGAWACAPEHEAWRKADVALLRTDMPKGAAGAVADLPALEAALAHAPPAPLGGLAECDGQTVAFNSTAALGALVQAAVRKPAPGAPPPPPFTVDSRPMPYAQLALLVGSIHNSAQRYDAALSALQRGLAGEPYNPFLVTETAFTLSHLGRNGEAAALCAQALAVDTTAPPRDIARLHRSRGYALGEMARYDEAIADYRASQALDAGDKLSANEITYLEGRRAGRGVSQTKALTSDQIGQPPR